VSLRFAILTALIERESTGLELSRRFDRSIGHFWPASHQQIYRELERLAADGLIAVTAAPERPRRGQPKAYAIAPAGVEALREWLARVDDPTPRREALYVRVRASAALLGTPAGEGGLDAVRASIRHHLALHEQRLEEYAAIEARDFDPPPDRRAAVQHLVLQAGLRTERSLAEWCRHALAELDAIEERYPE